MRFENNIDNEVWAGILVITDILNDKASNKFDSIFLSDDDLRKYVFEVNIGMDSLSVAIDQCSMQYKLTVGGEDAFYRVNFKDQNNVFEELDLSKYEKLYDNFLNLIKKEQPNISTAISLVA